MTYGMTEAPSPNALATTTGNAAFSRPMGETS
jgi:hypothetical protein